MRVPCSVSSRCWACMFVCLAREGSCSRPFVCTVRIPCQVSRLEQAGLKTDRPLLLGTARLEGQGEHHQQ